MLNGPKSSTEYDGPALGRDDPVWPPYLTESSKRDTDLVDGWNKSMDVLLLFAALFSAVVTAFLIESYKNLKPDAAIVTAEGVSRMVDLVEAIASRQAPPLPSKPLSTIDSFQPTRGDIIINTLWFFSLALSMSVSLIAMLVKQWGDGYRRGDRFSPHYVQARTRQARYNGLKNWGTKMVVRMLPIMMHIALGLFLLGLLLLLNSLDLRLMRPIMAVVVITLGLYVFTTLLPLISTFCPYNTPLSSRTVWGFFYSIVNLITPSGEKWNTLPCERKERAQSTSTALDRLTAQAVVWLVSHSQAEESVDTAIRAIANAVAGPRFWDHLIKDKLITLMAQRFISFFKGTLDRPDGNSVDKIISSDDVERRVSMCSQALAKVAKHSTIQLIQDAVQKSTIPQRALKESGRMMLPEGYYISVQDGLDRLIESKLPNVAASGFCGASAWYTSTGRTNRAARKQSLLLELITFIKDKSLDGQISSKQLVDLLEALAVETSYMIWELQEDDMNRALKGAVELCSSGHPGGLDLLKGPTRRATSVELAVVAALINDYQKISEAEIDQLSEEEPGKHGIHSQHMKAHEAYKIKYPYPKDSYSTYSRQWRAVWIAELCAKNPKYLEAHSDALLFFGLAGILRSLRMDSSQFIRMVKLFIAQLKLTEVNHPDQMSLPFILVSSCDVRSQVALDVSAAFHVQPARPDDHEIGKAKISLLQCLMEHGQWIEFRPVLLVEILKMLKLPGDEEFQRQCILALDNYWFMTSASGFDVYNLPDWELLVDLNLVYVLVRAWSFRYISENIIKLRSSTISCFDKLARTVKIQRNNSTTTVNQTPNLSQPTEPSPPQEIVDSLKQLLLNHRELFEVFARDIACGENPEVNKIDLSYWRDAILLLPDRLTSSATSQASTVTMASNQGSTNSIVPSAAASASSQVLPTSTGPQLPSANGQPVASSSQLPGTNSYLQVPSTSTGAQAPPNPGGATIASTSQIPSSSATTSPSGQTSMNSISLAPAPAPQVPPMTHDQARVWLQEFADDNNNPHATEILRIMAQRLIARLNQNP